MAEAEAEIVPEIEGGWLSGSIPDEELEHLLDHAENLEQTKVSYLWPLLLGILAGVGLPLGLLLASL